MKRVGRMEGGRSRSCKFYYGDIRGGLGDGNFLLMDRHRALFYRGLAELKYLGLVKNSRKKTDHLTKLAWKGL